MRGKTPTEVSEQATTAIEAVSGVEHPVPGLEDREQSPREALLMPSEPGRYLEVQGPLEATLIALEPGITHIGRGLAADLRLDDTSVSRRHAIMISRPTEVRVLDDRSSFGTIVNGSRVTQRELHDGDVLTLGRVTLRYREVTERDLKAHEALGEGTESFQVVG